MALDPKPAAQDYMSGQDTMKTEEMHKLLEDTDKVKKKKH